MKDANLFQLGIGLETGAQEEDTIEVGFCPATEIPANEIPANANAVFEPATVRDVLDEDRDDHFIRREGKVYAGTHLILEVVNGHGLDDEDRIQGAFREIVDVCGATLLHIHTHKFSPQGVSGVAVLAESHISVHTWPEIGYGAFDVFMCGDARPHLAIDVLKRAFGTEDVRVDELLRGDGLVTDEAAA